MQAEQHKIVFVKTIETEQQLIKIITATYQGRNQAKINQAQLTLSHSFSNLGFVERLAGLINKTTYQNSIGIASLNDLKKAAASLLKNYSFDLAQREGDKSSFIEILYNLIMQQHLDTKIKQLLGGALEHQFNRDQKAFYKNIVKQKILEIFVKQDAIAIFDSCIVIIQAHFNSLLAQPDQMIDYFTEIIQPVSSTALQIYEFISKMPTEKWQASDKIILAKLSLLFEFLDSAFQNLLQEQEFYGDDLKMIRKNEFLNGLLENYLLLFHNNHSIISNIYPSVNRLKVTITNIVKVIYHEFECPQKMFQIVFLTVLSESKEMVSDSDAESILANCLRILQSHLQIKSYANLFQQHKMELIFALLTYSVANAQEYDYIQNEPQLFAQLAEQFTEGLENTCRLKVSAASVLRIFAERIDEAPRSILEIIMVILSSSMGGIDQNSELMQQVKTQFSRFKFYSLTDQQKVETSLMVLSALAVQVGKRHDMGKEISSFFLVHFQTLVNIQSHIVILRIIRCISYYPSALYFTYIESQMGKGKVFVLEGVKSLERILRTNKYSELFQFLSSIFTKLMAVVRIEDPVVQLIIINYYDQMIKANSELYRVCRTKIKQSFFQNANINKHATIICFNLLYSLIKKQKDPNLLPHIQHEFYQISAFLESDGQLELYNTYEEKLIEIYQIIMEKSYNIKPQVERFALRSLRFLARQQKGTQIFHFYNIYLVKLDGAIFKLDKYFRAFWEQVQRRYQLFKEAQESLEAIAYYCFLMSQIIANHCEIMLTEDDLKKLMQIAQAIPKAEKQYPILVILTYLYMQPYPTVNFLKKYNVYEQFLNGVTQIQYEGAIVKKIFNLAYIMLLQIQENPTYIKQILIQCIHNLKELNRKTRRRVDNSHSIEVKARRFGQQRVFHAQNESSMLGQQNDNELINLFVKFKHPFEMLSEFDQFKVKFWMNDHLIGDLDPEIKEDLRSIMQTEMIDKTKVRIIKKIKR